MARVAARMKEQGRVAAQRRLGLPVEEKFLGRWLTRAHEVAGEQQTREGKDRSGDDRLQTHELVL